MAGETSTPKKPNKNSNQNKGKTNRTTVNDKENKPAKDSGGGATSQRRRRPRKKPQEKPVKTSQSSTVDELAAGVKKIELSPGQQNDEKPKAGKRYTTSFWRRERKQSEKESAVKDETAEKGKEGNQSDDDCNNIWGKEIVYDIDYWKNYTPVEPTEEEKFRIHTPGRKLRGYDDTPVELSGPEPKTFELMQSFKQAPLASAVLSNVQKSSFEKPTPVQKYAIPVIFSGRDFMACAPTGSGKTAAYLLPIISNLLKMGDDLPGYSEIASPLALILLPTQDLAQQIYVDALRFTHKTDIRVVRVYGQCSHEEQILQLNNECGCHIVIATPGRLLTFMKELGQKPCEISLGKVKYFVLDEADHMLVRYKSVYKHGDSDTGSDLGSLSDSDGDDESQARNKSMAKSGFYHDVKKIVRRCEVYPEHSMPPKESRQTLMFSASLPKKFQWYARKKFLRDDYLHLLVGDEVASTCPDVEQVVLRVPAKEKRDKLLAILQEELKDKPKRIVVFVRHKQRFNNQRARDSVSEIVKFLSNNGMNVTGISSGRVQQEREESLREFRGKKGESEVAVPIIVATAVGSRGLDIEGVELVINYDLPDTRYVGIEEYVHKVGRTGRIGNPGKAISFFDEEKDMEIARSLRKELREFVPEWLDEICESNKAFGTKEDHKLLVSRDIRYISRR